MLVFKKLVFALPFILFFSFFNFQLASFLQNPYLFLSFDFKELTQTILLIISLLSAGLSFTIFTALASDPKIVLPVAIFASIIPLFFVPIPLSLILVIGFAASFIISFLLLSQKLQTYLTFNPNTLLAPSINQLVMFILIAYSIAFYLAFSSEIKQNGFKIPDSIINLSLDLSQNQASQEVNSPSSSQLSISQEQLSLLKQNPDLVKQAGLDPKILDNLSSPKSQLSVPSLSEELLKPMVEQQLNQIIQPNLTAITIILALTFFFSLKWVAGIFSLFLHPLLWLIFLALEKTGFTKYETTTREVKKLVM